MQNVERNPQFTNPLVRCASPYLRQHAHNPVYWYPWGEEALNRAREENKPILLSIGYSTCYWCHVMEREVFENLSIASLMNRTFINIKVDREEHPGLDEIFMVARQLMTHEGGWPNNVFLTPDLKPFYAGGTYAPDEAYNKPAFPRLLEWLHYSWTTQEDVVRQQAEDVAKVMQPYLVYAPKGSTGKADIAARMREMFIGMSNYHDANSGGFFQAPKFPHECYLQFLSRYYEYSGDARALHMLTHSLAKMAAGGIYDHVGCGFHRYAVDKEWYVPHFEKMLYNQAQLARLYTDAARFTGSEYMADIAKSVLDFVSAPFTDGNGAFYAALDAETDQVEGAYYAWTAEEIQKVLSPEEANFFVAFYALADIPAFPGHKHAEGQVIIARKPLEEAAVDHKMPYVELAAMTGHVMNKLLLTRNQRKSPGMDDKIITAWNGLMIDAYAHAGKCFAIDRYVKIARRAADFLLEHAIDNEGKLCRLYIDGRPQLAATLEDYAYLVRGLISLVRAGEADMLEHAVALMQQAEEIFADPAAPGYFSLSTEDALWVRPKGADDSAMPNPNAAMLRNLCALYELTKEPAYRERAQAMVDYFLGGDGEMMMESASMVEAALALAMLDEKRPAKNESFVAATKSSPGGAVKFSATLFPQDVRAGEECEVLAVLDIRDGWRINANRLEQPLLIPTQVDVQGDGVQLLEVVYPEPLRRTQGGETLLVYEGMVNITARIRMPQSPSRPAIRVSARYQPCEGQTCHRVRDVFITL